MSELVRGNLGLPAEMERKNGISSYSEPPIWISHGTTKGGGHARKLGEQIEILHCEQKTPGWTSCSYSNSNATQALMIRTAHATCLGCHKHSQKKKNNINKKKV